MMATWINPVSRVSCWVNVGQQIFARVEFWSLTGLIILNRSLHTPLCERDNRGKERGKG